MLMLSVECFRFTSFSNVRFQILSLHHAPHRSSILEAPGFDGDAGADLFWAPALFEDAGLRGRGRGVDARKSVRGDGWVSFEAQPRLSPRRPHAHEGERHSRLQQFLRVLLFKGSGA